MKRFPTPVLGSAMAQAVSRRTLTAKAWVHTRINPCGIYGEQSDTGTGFSPSSLILPCQYHSTVAVHTRVSSRRWTIGPFVTAVQRRSLTRSTLTSWVGLLHGGPLTFSYKIKRNNEMRTTPNSPFQQTDGPSNPYPTHRLAWLNKHLICISWRKRTWTSHCLLSCTAKQMCVSARYDSTVSWKLTAKASLQV
jgi:hypothetical protein